MNIGNDTTAAHQGPSALGGESRRLLPAKTVEMLSGVGFLIGPGVRHWIVGIIDEDRDQVVRRVHRTGTIAYRPAEDVLPTGRSIMMVARGNGSK